jgi:hypothetical protein
MLPFVFYVSGKRHDDSFSLKKSGYSESGCVAMISLLLFE